MMLEQEQKAFAEEMYKKFNDFLNENDAELIVNVDLERVIVVNENMFRPKIYFSFIKKQNQHGRDRQ